MDKIPVDTSNGNSSQAWLTLAALLLHVARYPQVLYGAVSVGVDWWQHAEIHYVDRAAAQSAEQLTKADDALVRGSVLWTAKREMTVSLRRGLEDTLRQDTEGAWAKLATDYPAGVLLMDVDQYGVAIVRELGVRLPPVWQRFGRVAENLPGSVRLTWLAKAAV